MHTRDELVDAAMAAFDATMQRAPGFRSRAGQRAMALEAAQAFAAATLGETADQPERDIRVLQAGTGVGKSAAYAVVGITIAKLRGVKLVLSSSSVALQEQLLTKDLPLLAAHMPEPFTFAIAKGRGRYACVLKLQELAAGDPQLLALDDGPDAGDALPTPPKDASGEQHQVHFYRRLAADLAAGTWAGDKDSLESPPLPNEWTSIAAERNTCTVRHCPRFNDCVYYRARSQLAATDVIVANHDLVLASLGAPVLPDLSKCLVVFDEAHHLPAKAIEHFASEVDLTRLAWLDKFPVALVTAAAELSHPLTIQPQALAREMKGALSDLGRLIWDLNASGMRESDGVCRLAENALHGPLQAPLAAVLARARELERCAQDVCSAVRERMQDPEQDRSRWAVHYAAIGAFAPRLGAVSHCMDLLLNEGDEARQTAKWCSVSRGNSGTLFLHVHACPIIPGQLLAFHLWHRVRAGVLTSATLASCGSFSYFLREAGLDADPAVTTRSVPSPFDHRKQAQLIVQRTAVAPRNTAAFNAETTGRLAADLAQTRRGALVLFTSRRHMEETHAALDEALRSRVLVQGSRPNSHLLAQHRELVGAGRASILFGLQSFGEGLDLPGELCEQLYICKLPFQPPSDPVGQARADFVQASGGDAFFDLVVPAAGVRMLQWTGRGIRTETDRVTITCYDARLVDTDFGKRILSGLPPYPLRVLAAGAPSLI